MSSARRLFFSLPLEPTLQNEIVHWRAGAFSPESGKPIAAANLHLTLAFLGDIGEQKSQALQRVAGRIAQKRFTLIFDDLGHWPRPGVVWLGIKRCPRPLLQLAELLRSHAARNGCVQDFRPFHPHVTLLRGATHPVSIPPATPNWAMQATSFSLCESLFEKGRTRYRTVEEWPFHEIEQ